MKLAFCILTHKQPDSQFIDLLEFISKFENVTIVIHHDYSQSTFEDSLIEKYNLHMIHPSIKTQWSHISKVFATISIFTKIAEISPDVDWIITLSANCLPIKPREHIKKFFEDSSYDYYMFSHPIGMQFDGIYKWHYQALFTKYLFSFPFFTRKGKFYMKAFRIPINPASTGFKNYKAFTGSDWFFINNKTLFRVLDAGIANHPISKHVAKQNMAPDMTASAVEIVLQTFILNQEDLKGCDNYYRYINWEGTTDWHPNTLTLEHWEDIKNNEALFARKFDVNKSKELIEKIKKELW